ncbi:hypothetical protein [Emergencia timonensis]|uniref:hypothetical protein n=1 Tax=Emergencia timonensis TaxID=1776384 RepID=UPI001FCAD1EC|nr:hypothetical protein [Emergencia timonensis]
MQESDWCRDCMETRDREVMHCIIRIRLATGLELNRDDSEKLILSYFRKGEKE